MNCEITIEPIAINTHNPPDTNSIHYSASTEPAISVVDTSNPGNRNVVFDVRGLGMPFDLLITRDMVTGFICRLGSGRWYAVEGITGLKFHLEKQITLPVSIGAGFKEHGPNVKFKCYVHGEFVRICKDG